MITEFKYKETVYNEGGRRLFTPPLEIILETGKEDYDLTSVFDDDYKQECLEGIDLKDYLLESLSVKVNNNPWGEISFEYQDGKLVLFENNGNEEYHHGLTIEQVFCVFNLGRPLSLGNLESEVEEALKSQIAFNEGYS